MDNITHTVIGVALAQAGLKRIAPRSFPAVADDPREQMGLMYRRCRKLGRTGARYLDFHRGYTHSFVGAQNVALAAAALCLARAPADGVRASCLRGCRP